MFRAAARELTRRHGFPSSSLLRRSFSFATASLPAPSSSSSSSSLLRSENLERVSNDLEKMHRVAIKGAHVPDARSVLVPLALLDDKAYVLLTVQSTQLLTTMLTFPRGHRSRHTSQCLDKDAVEQACDQLGGTAKWADPERIAYLGTHHDAVNSRRTHVVTPGVAFFGELRTKREVRERNESSNCVLGVAAIRIEDCLKPDNITVVKMSDDGFSGGGNSGSTFSGAQDEEEDVEPMPAFTVPRKNVVGWGEGINFGTKDMLIWGSDAAILHSVLRVLVGGNERYKQQLYGQFEKINRELKQFVC